MGSRLSIAVLSDLHFSKPEAATGKTFAIVGEHAQRQHPPRDVLDLMDREQLSADIVLCPGDLTLGACGVGLERAWRHLHEVREKLGACHVLAATGNHDIESRDIEGTPEIWERLKKLSPTYPSSACDELQRLHYWAEHFCILEQEWVRIVLLNSCNSHARGAAEYESGRVTEYTLQLLLRELESRDKRCLNILMCHHHPSALPELTDRWPDYSEMKHGAKLLSALEGTGDAWLVVHGHKHIPRIEYAKGGSDSPVVFSAGSYSAQLPPQFIPTAANQFYIIDIEQSEIDSLGACGTVRAWDWVNGQGWMRANKYDPARQDRILYGSGFGCRTGAGAIADQIAKAMSSQRATWDFVLGAVPLLRYQRIPDRITTLQKMAGLGLSTSSPDPLDPMEVVRESA